MVIAYFRHVGESVVVVRMALGLVGRRDDGVFFAVTAPTRDVASCRSTSALAMYVVEPNVLLLKGERSAVHRLGEMVREDRAREPVLVLDRAIEEVASPNGCGSPMLAFASSIPRSGEPVLSRYTITQAGVRVQRALRSGIYTTDGEVYSIGSGSLSWASRMSLDKCAIKSAELVYELARVRSCCSGIGVGAAIISRDLDEIYVLDTSTIRSRHHALAMRL